MFGSFGGNPIWSHSLSSTAQSEEVSWDSPSQGSMPAGVVRRRREAWNNGGVHESRGRYSEGAGDKIGGSCFDLCQGWEKDL